MRELLRRLNSSHVKNNNNKKYSVTGAANLRFRYHAATLDKSILGIKSITAPVGSVELWVDGGVHACPVCGLCEKLLIHTVLQAVRNTTLRQKKNKKQNTAMLHHNSPATSTSPPTNLRKKQNNLSNDGKRR